MVVLPKRHTESFQRNNSCAGWPANWHWKIDPAKLGNDANVGEVHANVRQSLLHVVFRKDT